MNLKAHKERERERIQELVLSLSHSIRCWVLHVGPASAAVVAARWCGRLAIRRSAWRRNRCILHGFLRVRRLLVPLGTVVLLLRETAPCVTCCVCGVQETNWAKEHSGPSGQKPSRYLTQTGRYSCTAEHLCVPCLQKPRVYHSHG